MPFRLVLDRRLNCPGCDQSGVLLLRDIFPAPHLGFGVRLPMFHPHPLRVLTTFGRTAAVSGTRMNMKDLWMT
jgi:hypothetical protein